VSQPEHQHVIVSLIGLTPKAIGNMANYPVVLDLTGDNEDDIVEEEYTCTVPGPPKPMPRPRKYRNIWVNPARKDLIHFRYYAVAARRGYHHFDEVHFDKDIPVEVTIKFYLRRPNVDFVRCNRMCQMLKKWAGVRSAPPTGPDVDNMAKFVLDGLNGIAYHDDRQVVKLVAYKFRDNNGDCEGRTEVSVKEYKEGSDNK
jgi:Holliday junction resolvase RusA-like endonuclease